jgi:alpha-tubulin suppressor-like RCC1 family protein
MLLLEQLLSISPPVSEDLGPDQFLYTWGRGDQLGVTFYSGDPASWTAVSAGRYHNGAIRSDGALFTWGRNNLGQLGAGGVASVNSPIQIGTSSWTAISAGETHTAAIRSDGALFAWGSNRYGQLANPVTGYFASVSSPVQIGTSSWTAVSAGGSHTVAIRSDGALFAWGDRRDGQLGDGVASAFSFITSPIQIGTSSWTAVSAGGTHTAAIRSDGALFTWGRNNAGQLGNGTSSTRSSPVQIGTSSWTAVSAGVQHTAAIRSGGSLFTWGLNNSGQLGDGSTSNRSSPVQVGTSSWTAVTAGWFATAAIKLGGSLFTWGRNYWGGLGIGALGNRSSPVQVGTSSWTAVAMTYNHTVAIRSDSRLFTWGRNNFGQLGNFQPAGDSTSTSSPVQVGGNQGLLSQSSPVQIGTSSWTAVSAGQTHTAAIRSDGALFAWGVNSFGQLGDGTTTNKFSPVQIGTSKWIAVAAGGRHTAAIKLGGTLFTWGNNTYGELGTSTTSRSSPAQVGTSNWKSVAADQGTTAAIRSDGALFTWGKGTILGSQTDIFSWTAVSAGGTHTAAIRSDGALFTWGVNTSGQLGDSVESIIRSPIQIGTSSWTAVSAGSEHTAAIRSDGALFTWGANSNGQLGDADFARSSPVQIGTSSWTAVSTGANLTAAIRLGGSLFTWGFNYHGQLGDGTSGTGTEKSSPVQIGTSSWTAVSTGQRHTAAIRSDGALFTWGYNNFGQLGLTSTPNSWTAIAAGGLHTAAIRSDGALFTWGDNTYGRLGDGTSGYGTNTSSPIQIGTSSWTAVSAGRYHTAAIRLGGSLFTWGRNSRGQLGDGTVGYGTNKSSPVQIGTSSWTAVSAGNNHTAAIRSGGALFTWGSNNNGQLGHGTPGYGYGSSSPVQVGTSSWTAVSAGGEHTAAIRSGGSLFAWGFNYHGQVGFQNSPKSWAIVSSGGAGSNSIFAAAIRSDGALFTWGSGRYGTLGNNYSGYSLRTSNPIQIGTSSWTAVSAGTNHVAAIRLGGGLFTWGANQLGQLGDSENIGYGGASYSGRSSPVQIGTSSWTAVSAGRNHTAAIRSGGSLFTWGYNGVGQLGNGTTTSRSSPVQIGTSSWTAVSAGAGHTAAIRSGGSLFTWGSAAFGALGDGTTTDKSSPVQIGTSSWTAVSAGNAHTAAIRSGGSLFTWGYNYRGQLGDGTTTDKSSPVQIGTSLWTAVSAGVESLNTAAIRSDGALFIWGNNDNGQLGIGLASYSLSNVSSPVQVGSGSWTAVSMSAGRTGFAITSTNLLASWGANGAGQLGQGVSRYSTYSTSSPAIIGADTPPLLSSPVQIGTSSWTAVSAGNAHTAAIRSGGSLFTWGQANYGQLGDGSQGFNVRVVSPVQIGTSSWTAVSAGALSTFAIRQDGLLFGTGFSAGVYGSISFIQIGSGTWSKISAGQSTNGGIQTNNLLYMWGSGYSGQLGLGNITRQSDPRVLGQEKFDSQSSPVQIGTGSWTAVSAGHSHTAAIRSDGALFTCGSNRYGQLGDGSATGYGVAPVITLTQIGNSSWIAVDAGSEHTAAIRSDGALFTWGRNSTGQLGNGTSATRSSPVQIGTGLWTSVSAGSEHTAAIRSDGALFAWGRNDVGQVGININTPAERIPNTVGNNPTLLAASSPVQIGTSSWTAVGVGTSHVAAIRSDSALFTWGRNAVGQLGNGTNSDKFSPVQVGTSSWTAVSAGAFNTAAIRSDGALFTWGTNFFGQIGDGVGGGYGIFRSSPVQVGTSSWTAVSVGKVHNIAAIRSDGALFAWGSNTVGQLSDGTTTTRSSPVQVGTSSWTAVSFGGYHVMGRKTN